jgi:hypothetical protein
MKVALSSLSISSLRKRPLLAAALVTSVLGLAWYGWVHHQYGADVAIICNAESQTETTLASARTIVEGVAAPKISTSKGEELFKTLRAAPPESAARQLERAAAAAGISDCPSVRGYQKLAARASLSDHADRMCRRLDPITLAKVPRAKRVGFLVSWAHDHFREDDLDAFLAPIASLPIEQAGPRLRQSLSELDVHTCGLLLGLESPVSPQSGPNVIIQSFGIPTDDREAEMKDVFQKRADDLVDCYRKGLAKDRDASGTLSLKFRLTEKGVIDFVLAQTDSSIHSPVTATCVTDLVKTFTGPAGKATSPGGVILEFWTAP